MEEKRREQVDRADRQVDLPVDHEERLARRQDRERREVGQQRLEVVPAEERVRLEREVDRDHDRDQDHAALAQGQEAAAQPRHPLPLHQLARGRPCGVVALDGHGYFETPAAVLVPSYRDLVFRYGPTVCWVRNFSPVLTSAVPVSVCDALYMKSSRIGRNPCRYGCWSIVKSISPAASRSMVGPSRSKPPAFTPCCARAYFLTTWATPWVLPASTANSPFVVLWPVQ